MDGRGDCSEPVCSGCPIMREIELARDEIAMLESCNRLVCDEKTMLDGEVQKLRTIIHEGLGCDIECATCSNDCAVKGC